MPEEMAYPELALHDFKFQDGADINWDYEKMSKEFYEVLAVKCQGEALKVVRGIGPRRIRCVASPACTLQSEDDGEEYDEDGKGHHSRPCQRHQGPGERSSFMGRSSLRPHEGL